MSQPSLTKKFLLKNGFRFTGTWEKQSSTLISLRGDVPNQRGVYCFCINEVAHYIGVASKDLKKRLYFYQKPGPSQSTNIRLNSLISSQIDDGHIVEVLVATPPDFEWEGLKICGTVGLEAGLIRDYFLPWNVQGKATSHATNAVAKAAHVQKSTSLPNGSKGKYMPLRKYLIERGRPEVSMTFASIEALIGKLPKSAYLHQAWWANHEGNSQAKAWMGAKYLVQADPKRRSVIFRKFSY